MIVGTVFRVSVSKIGPSCQMAACLLVLALWFPVSSFAADRNNILVFAAASTAGAVEDIAKLYSGETGAPVSVSLAASSVLARQIEAGAPADVFISANPEWMDFLQKKGRLVVGSRFVLVKNRLAVLGTTPVSAPGTVTSSFPLEALLGPDGRIAMGDPNHVPGGMYGKAALQSLGLWGRAAPHIAAVANQRAALALLTRGEVPISIGYASDGALSPKVHVQAFFPVGSHPDIAYPVALVQGDQGKNASDFLSFLFSNRAQDVFRRYGFGDRD